MLNKMESLKDKIRAQATGAAEKTVEPLPEKKKKKK